MDQLVVALAARRYFLEGRSKKEIGDELGISRFRVARLLDDARRDGVVRIEVEAPAGVDFELSQRVAARLGLRQVVVLGHGDGDGPEGGEQPVTRRQLGRACAALLVERLTPDDVLGVSWGRTLHALTDVMPALPRVTVVQLVGGVPTADLNVNPQELVRRLGEVSGGRTHALHVPMVLDTPQLAASLRAADFVAGTLARFDEITCALVGVGAWTPGGSSLRGALPDDVVHRLDASHAVADVCSTVLAADGSVVGGDLVPARCVAITTDQLRAVPDVVALAGGAEKAAAISAAARSGLLHRLVTDAAAARALLAH